MHCAIVRAFVVRYLAQRGGRDRQFKCRTGILEDLAQGLPQLLCQDLASFGGVEGFYLW